MKKEAVRPEDMTREELNKEFRLRCSWIKHHQKSVENSFMRERRTKRFNKRLQEIDAKRLNEMRMLERKINKLENDSEIMREALDLYGYHKIINIVCSRVVNGFGSKARAALEKVSS